MKSIIAILRRIFRGPATDPARQLPEFMRRHFDAQARGDFGGVNDPSMARRDGGPPETNG